MGWLSYRYPMNGKIKTADMKVNWCVSACMCVQPATYIFCAVVLTLPCPASSRVRSLIQATLGCLPVQDFALNQDTQKIFRAVTRLSKCRHILTSAAHPQPPYTAHIHGRVLCTTATRCCMWRGPFSAAVCGEGPSLLLCVERALLCYLCCYCCCCCCRSDGVPVAGEQLPFPAECCPVQQVPQG